MLDRLAECFTGYRNPDSAEHSVLALLAQRIQGLALGCDDLNDHDVPEAVKLADYLYVMSEGRIVGHGPTREMIGSDAPSVRQLLHAEPDGPVPFHFRARLLAEELELAPVTQ